MQTYCGKCGAKLKEVRTPIPNSYNVFDGKQNERTEWICPNRTLLDGIISWSTVDLATTHYYDSDQNSYAGWD